jgi:hypothetical protein
MRSGNRISELGIEYGRGTERKQAARHDGFSTAAGLSTTTYLHRCIMESRKRKSTKRPARKPRRKPGPSLTDIQDRINNARAAASVASDALDERHEEAACLLFEAVVMPLLIVRHQLERLARGGAK